MQDPLGALRAALEHAAGALVDGLVLEPHHRRSAHRALRRHDDGARIGRAASRAGSAPLPGITSPARRTTTVSPIMNPLRATSSMLCSVALLTVTPPTNTGLSFAAGVSAPVRPTLKITSSSSGHLFVGRELVRQRPARRARDEAELLLVGAAIYLVDHAVDLVRQLGAARADVAVVLEAALDADDLLRLRAGAQAPAN